VLDVEENWLPDEDYFIHIDVLHGSSDLVSKRINSHMIRNDAFDPRRIFQIPIDWKRMKLILYNEEDNWQGILARSTTHCGKYARLFHWLLFEKWLITYRLEQLLVLCV